MEGGEMGEERKRVMGEEKNEGKKMPIRGMTEQIFERQRGSVSILHPQWELRPAGWVAVLPPPPSIVFLPGSSGSMSPSVAERRHCSQLR